MAKTQTVTISLEEYKELLLKDRPSNTEHMIFSRIMDVLTEYIEYSEERTWSSDYLGNNMEITDSSKAVKEIVNIIKYTDFEKYMEIWNNVQTAERNRKAMEEQIDQMNRAKEMREENNNGKNNK